MIARKLFCLCAAVVALCALSANALSPREEIMKDKNLSTANFQVYPAPAGADTVSAPPGYEPYYISSYARHGSRFLIHDEEYDNALVPLEKADSAGILTAEGRRVADCIRRIKGLSAGRLGELTDVGAAQHRGIARRLYESFPQVYEGNPVIRARSTVVIRCIMSMMAECLALQAENPDITFVHDASRADMARMNDTEHHFSLAGKYGAACDSAVNAATDALDAGRLSGVLFTDAARAESVVGNASRLMHAIFIVAQNMQSHADATLDIMDVFTPEECYELWKVNNTYWYYQSGNTPLTGYEMPYGQENLFKDFLDDGDAAAASTTNGATLRFGHESVVLPAAVFFELNGADYTTDDLADAHEHWADYRYFPMAANLQFVFYRNPAGGDVLVRVLLNERDATLPVAPVTGCFYSWADLSRYYRAKLARRAEAED